MEVTEMIAETLLELFSDINQIRSNQLEQGNKEHSFYIRNVRTSARNELSNIQDRNHSFVLHYFPKKYPETSISLAESDCREMQNRLFATFIYLKDFNGKIVDTNSEIVNGVLQFHFRIRMRYLLPKAEEIKMQTLEERSNLID